MSTNPLRKGESGVEVRIESVPKSGYIGVLVCGRIHGYRVHFVGKKKPPRLCFHDDCPLCRPSDPPPRWYGYVAAELSSGASNKWTPAVLEVTEQCYHCLQSVDLPGTLWWMWRAPGVGKRMEVVAERAEHPGTDRYTRSIAVQQALCRVYRVNQLPPEVAPPVRQWQEVERVERVDLPVRRPQDRSSCANVGNGSPAIPAGKTMRQLQEEFDRSARSEGGESCST